VAKLVILRRMGFCMIKELHSLRRYAAAFCSLILTGTALACGAEVYVSPTGNDGAGGTLVISQDGDYRVTITSALGRTVKEFMGKGNSGFVLNDKKIPGGVYVVSIRLTKGVVTQKISVH
jgi:hypothetical protein